MKPTRSGAHSPTQPTVAAPDYTPTMPSQLLPRFSFRTLFLITLAVAVLATAARAAGNGMAIASGLLAAVFLVIVPIGFMTIVFSSLWLIALITHRGVAEDPANPFAEDQLPPQILPPRDPTQ